MEFSTGGERALRGRDREAVSAHASVLEVWQTGARLGCIQTERLAREVARGMDGEKKSKLVVFHEIGLPKKLKVHELRK